jgi:anti-sigma B factor antagonist
VLFEIERATVAGRPALAVRGELDLVTAPELAAAVERELAAGPSGLVLDLTPTRFLDSSGARGLVRAAREAASAGVALHVICPRSNRPVRLVIDLLELERVVPIVESPDDVTTAVADQDGRP